MVSYGASIQYGPIAACANQLSSFVIVSNKAETSIFTVEGVYLYPELNRHVK